jgi:signal transduction histidine kinase
MVSPSGEVMVATSLGRHLALAPVAFAVTEGPTHAVVYANNCFRLLQSKGQINIGPRPSEPGSAADLTSLLDRVFRTGETVRDELIEGISGSGEPAWSCTVWPVPGEGDAPGKLVIELRDVEVVEGAKSRQRAIAQRLLLSALRDEDSAHAAEDASLRATYLASTSRALAMSLDEAETRDTIRHLALPRPGTWCIVDVIESNGAIHRLAVVHPDPAKQALARALEDEWPAQPDDPIGAPSVLRSEQPSIVTHESGAALLLAARGPTNLRILREIGFGALLVVPLVVRGQVRGAITFVSPAGDPPFSQEEIGLAADVATVCAMALDNARLYREADTLRVAAEGANRAKSQFLGSMSHELRTPLNAIGGFAELMEMGAMGPVSDEQHTSLARIRRNQEHLLTLVVEILNFVRVESGRMEYRVADVPMESAIGDIAEMLSGVIKEKGLVLEGPHCEATAVVRADPDRVRQILLNLVMNAVKYTPLGGGTISLSCAVTSDSVITNIADTGRGIPPDKLEAIFEPFVQLTAGLADRQGGVGLGLAISRDLARGMGGDLTVRSTVDVGSRFTLTLPRAGSVSTSVSAEESRQLVPRRQGDRRSAAT